MNDLTLFDYANLTEGEATEVRAAAERIRVRMKRTAEDIVAIGLDLIAVKEQLPHGSFLPWIETEFGMSERAARNFIAVGRHYGKSAIIADLTPTALYELAAPSTPQEVRDQIDAKVDAGETPTVAEIKKLKADIAAERQRAEQAESTADNLKTQNQSLLEGQAALAENARSKAYAEAQAELEKAREAAASAMAEVDAMELRLASAQDEAKSKAEAQAQAQAAQYAQEELAKLEARATKAKSDEATARKAVERLRENQERMAAKVKEYEEYQRQIKGRDIEAKGIRDSLTEVNRAINMAMVDLLDIEHEHGEEVSQKIANTANICEKFLGVLTDLSAAPAAPQMKVISND